MSGRPPAPALSYFRHLPLLVLVTIILAALPLLAACGKKKPKPPPTPTPFVLQVRATATPTAEPTLVPLPTPTPVVQPQPTPLWGSNPRPTPVPVREGTKSFYVIEPYGTEYRIAIPYIGVNAEVAAVGLELDGAMAEPPGPDVFGWFAFGAKPGEDGNVLMDCHLDYNDKVTGPRKAVCWRLAEVPVGAKVVLEDAVNRYTYEVEDTRRWAWEDPAALALLMPSSRPIVTIITCEGPGQFNPVTRNYPYRRTVVAKLVGTETK